MSAGLLAALRDLVPAMQRRAEALDAAEAPPLQDMAELRALGALTAPLPRAHGGLGAGTEPGGAALLLDVTAGRKSATVRCTGSACELASDIVRGAPYRDAARALVDSGRAPR